MSSADPLHRLGIFEPLLGRYVCVMATAQEQPHSDEELHELAARKLDPPPPPDLPPGEYSETLKALLASNQCKRIITSGPTQGDIGPPRFRPVDKLEHDEHGVVTAEAERGSGQTRLPPLQPFRRRRSGLRG